MQFWKIVAIKCYFGALIFFEILSSAIDLGRYSSLALSVQSRPSIETFKLVHVVLYVILDENLLLFTFLTGKLRKNLFWTNKKFVYLNITTNFRPKISSRRHVKVFYYIHASKDSMRRDLEL